MSDNKLKIITGGLGGAFLTICQVKSNIDEYILLPKIIYSLLLFFGIALLLFTGAIFLKKQLMSIFDKFDPIVNYDCEIAKESELPAIHAFCNNSIQDAFADLNRWIERYKVNSEIIFKVIEVRRFKFRTEKILIGGFSIFPLTKVSQNKIEKNDLKGVEILHTDLAKLGKTPSAFYIAWIIGRTYKGKAMSLSFLKEKLSSLVMTNDIMIYTKPSTNDGLRLVKRNNFSPLDKKTFELNKICKINGKQFGI